MQNAPYGQRSRRAFLPGTRCEALPQPPGGRTRRLPPSLRTGAALVVLTALLTCAIPAAAQSVQDLVSNAGQTLSMNDYASLTDQAGTIQAGQPFRTGSNAEGYGLTAISVNFISVNFTKVETPPPSLTASIWTTKGLTPGSSTIGDSAFTTGVPNTKLFDLTNPADLTTTGEKTFTAPPNSTLNASTTYAVVFTVVFPSPDEDGIIKLGVVTVGTEDGAPGWSIGNHRIIGVGPPPSTIWAVDGETISWSLKVRGTIAAPPPPPPPPPPSGRSRRPSRDDHANTPGQATTIPLEVARTSSTPGQLSPATDVDYFTVDIPHAGVVVVETTGPTDTMGTIWQDGAELARADEGGAGPNFRLSARVAARPVVIAVAGNRRQTGRYTLRVTLIVSYLENPGSASFQSGLGVISGWVCAAEEVEIELNGAPQQAAYGTVRADTEAVCGDSDNGFGLLFNWNLLGDGAHEVVVLVDGLELDRATVTVTTLGQEFLRDAEGTCELADFPTAGEMVALTWQEANQNFVLTEGSAPAVDLTPRSALEQAGRGRLENPGPASFQSGIGVISGWVCDAQAVTLEINGRAHPAAYGTARGDTQTACGDTDNGFGLLFNWNLLGDGNHTVVARADEEEVGRATVRVTTLGEEFVPDAHGMCVAEDFPRPDQTVTLTWQTAQQNFVITAVE